MLDNVLVIDCLVFVFINLEMKVVFDGDIIMF